MRAKSADPADKDKAGLQVSTKTPGLKSVKFDVSTDKSETQSLGKGSTKSSKESRRKSAF